VTFDSVGGRKFYLAIKVVVLLIVLFFAARSLLNSIAFTSLAYPGESVTGIAGGLFIQFSPNVFFALAGLSSGYWKWGWIVAGMLFTGIDIGTNIGYRANQQNESVVNLFGNPEVTIWAVRLGYFLDTAVAWAEEIMALVISAIIKDVETLYELRGDSRSIPDWAIFAGDVASLSRGGPGHPHNNNQQKQQKGQGGNQHNNGNRHNQQQGNNNGRRDNVRISDVPDRERNRIDEMLSRSRENGQGDFSERIDDRR
jgi:hypothetical protein